MSDIFYSDESRGYFSDIQYSPEPNTNILGNKEPFIEITEQPGDFRYRYEKEKYHGHILGFTSPATKKKDQCKFPAVKIHNYDKDVIIRCWLITTDLDEPKAHFHKLARKPPKGTLMNEPHDLRATVRNNYEVTFDYLHIVHAVVSDENDLNIYKTKKNWIRSRAYKNPCYANGQGADKEELKQMDKNQSILFFQAFDALTQEKICEAVSRKIMNLHNPETAALKIVNYSRTYGTCKGRDEVFIFVEKISKDVEVRFFEVNQATSQRSWQARADYGPQHVHHQYGIVFKTPPFCDSNLLKDALVYFELYRKTDGAKSEPVKYTYKPDAHCRVNNDFYKKRPHSPENYAYETNNMLFIQPEIKRLREGRSSPDTTTLENDFEFPMDYIPEDLLKAAADQVTQEQYGIWDSEPQYHTLVTSDLDKYQQHSITSDLQLMAPIPDLESLLENDNFCTDSAPSSIMKKPSAECPTFNTGVDDGISSEEVSSSNEILLNINSDDSHVKTIKDFNEIRNIRSVIENFVDVREAKKLLMSIAHINGLDFDGNSILLVASECSLYALAVLLKHNDVDRSVTNLVGDNALLCATRSRKEELAEMLLQNNFDPNIQNYKTGETPLHIALSQENVGLVKLLLKYGANPLVNNYGSYSSYDYSINCNSEELKRLIFRASQETFLAKKPDTNCNILNPSINPLEFQLVEELQSLNVS